MIKIIDFFKKIKLPLSLVFLIFLTGCASKKVNYPENLNQLHDNVIHYYLNIPNDYKKVSDLLEKLDKNGAWASIDYTDSRRGNWTVKEHLEYVQILARAYQTIGSPFYQKESVSKKIHLALNYWLKNDFLSTNWWDQHIGVPEALAPTLFLMEKELSVDQMKEALVLMRRADIKMTGQNKVWLSGNVIFRSLLTRDTDSIALASKSIQEELAVTSGEGIQSDWSYHQHGAQLQFGNYGMSYIEDMMRWYTILNKTSFSFQDSKKEILRNYVLYGQQWVTWKDRYDISASGRQLFQDEQHKKAIRLGENIQKMAVLDPQYQSEFTKALDYKNLNGNKYFWHSDFQVQRTNDYYFSLKMCSNRVLGGESVNQENILGYYMGDGVTFLYQNIKDYDNIAPFLDWKKLPGTTAIQDDKPLPVLTAYGYHNKSDFVGGVSDSINGIAVMDYNRDGVTAKKSWFMFEDKIVCLGTDINSDINFPVTTAVDQSFLNGSVLVSQENKIQKSNQAKNLDKIDWVLHNNKGYLFPQKGSAKIETKMIEASWNTVAKRYRPIILTNEIFRLWLNHGTAPKNSDYQYILVPNTNPEAMEQLQKEQPFEIVNNKNYQSVVSKKGTIAGIVFYEAAKATVFSGLSANQACVVMLKKENNGLKVSISDPTQKLKTINLTFNKKYKGNNLTAENNQSVLKVDLPSGSLAGKTVSFLLEE